MKTKHAGPGKLKLLSPLVLLLVTFLSLPVASWAGPRQPADISRPGRLRAPLNDLGFRPDPDGFSFENYGNDEVSRNLTEADVRALFGDEACSMTSGGKVVLTAPARQWMEEVNENMDNGHCEGMATLSLLFYTGEEDLADFGAESTYELSLEDEKLQSEIARWWVTQALDPTESDVIKGAPVDILNTLKDEMSKDGETYTVGIYKEDGSGGHAVTPYDVEDDGNGKYRIMIYDNNYPGEERAISVDANTNSWSYEASVNPEEESELYEGNAQTQTLDLTPTSSRTEQQSAPFARLSTGVATASLTGFAPSAQRYNQIFLNGRGHLLITDEQGRKLGYTGKTLVNEIPGAKYTRLKTDSEAGTGPEPLYWTPENMDFVASIDGTGLKSESPTDLIIIGPGFATGVEGIELEPGQTDTVFFDPSDQGVSYETDRTSSPNFVVSVDDKDLSYYFEIKGAKMQGGGTITAVLDTKEKDLLLNTEKLKNEGVFNLLMTRISSEDMEEIAAEDIKLPAGAVIYMHYGDWKGPGSPVQFGVDRNGDGEIDDVYEAETTSTGGGGGVPYYVWIIIACVVVLAGAVVVFLLVRRRGSAA